MHNPWSARQASSTAKVGATATPMVGATSKRLATRIARVRPIRSETGPHTHPPRATASTTTDTDRPAREGLTPKSLDSSGRIAWVEYIVANIPAAPSMKPASGRESVVTCERSVCRDGAEVPFVGTALDDVADLLDRVAQLVIAVVVMGPEADAGIWTEVAEDLPLGSSRCTAANSGTFTVTVPPRRVALRGLRTPKPAASARSISSCVWRRELSRMRSTPTSSIRS